MRAYALTYKGHIDDYLSGMPAIYRTKRQALLEIDQTDSTGIVEVEIKIKKAKKR